MTRSSKSTHEVNETLCHVLLMRDLEILEILNSPLSFTIHDRM